MMEEWEQEMRANLHNELEDRIYEIGIEEDIIWLSKQSLIEQEIRTHKTNTYD